MNDAIEYDQTQKNAIRQCCDTNKRVVAITGQAGTGKTTIMESVYRTLNARGKRVVLCAPTGKAAKRIAEATGINARTIHRLLEYPFPGEIDEETGKPLVSTDPKKCRRNPIDFDVVLVDEYAMVNVEVHRNLLDALPPGGVIRMFGDANQLQPIETNKRLAKEPSSFIKMLKKFDGIWLEQIHRQHEGSSIIENGNRILKGAMLKRFDDFELKVTDEPVDTIQEYIVESLADEIDFGQLSNQIITPTKIGWVGTEALNTSIQLLMHPGKKEYIELERHKWSKMPELRLYKDDKVIFTVNNYPLEIFNGETGIVEKINDNTGDVVVDFGDKSVKIPTTLEMNGKFGVYHINPQKDLDLAYVITTHKAQGSEYDRVMYVMNSSRSWLLNRKNFYTAISRAKLHVAVVTDQKALSTSLYKKGDK
jgi:exodeoxyribonuclease V alpha subunit